MIKNNFSHSLRIFFLTLYLATSLAPSFAWSMEDVDSVELFSAWQEQIVFTSRVPRPISKIADNVTVISADDILRLNAHTLEEVLQTVSGFQLYQVRTPGSTVSFTLNGSASNNVLVLIDGIPQNLLGAEESAELGMIPVERIERIEIIKGTASVVWGPALGGAVNIITRDPVAYAKLHGNVSASYGRSDTSDVRGGMTGTIDRLGYYLDAGSFNSKGVVPENRVTLGHAFGKLTYDLPGKGRLTFIADNRDGDRTVGFDDKTISTVTTLITSGSHYSSASLHFNYPLHDNLNLDLATSFSGKDIWQKWTITQPIPFLILDARNRTDSQQASAKLTWGDLNTNLVAGIEFQRDVIRVNEPQIGFSFLNFSRNLERYGAYLNGGYSLGPVTLLPGVRFDQIGNNEQVTSYTLGATWQLTENTLLRASAAKGYSLPSVNFHDSLQNIGTVQGGIESSAIPFVWLKGTLFYSNTWNIESWIVPPDYPSSPVSTSITHEIRQGFEIEGRSIPVYDLTLTAGFAYSDVRDKDTNVHIKTVPKSTSKLSLQYTQADRGLRALIAGYLVNWPSDAGNNVHDKQILWDFFLSQKLPAGGSITPEFFLSGHNLLNNVQYVDDFRINAPRWFEAGIRVNF